MSEDETGIAGGEGIGRDELTALLEFYAASGVDAVLADDPVDRFAESRQKALPAGVAERPARPQAAAPQARPAPPRAEPPQTRQPAQPARSATVPGDQAVAEARSAAREASTLDDLQAALAAFDGCNLKMTAKNLVFADGNPEARLMLVGEAPGRDEDIQGLPFVGRSGKLLDRMLHAIGLDRSGAYIANVVPWRPPGNRTPSPSETEICAPFIERQIELVSPEVLVFLGGASAKQLTGAREGIMRLRGKWLSYKREGIEIRAMATLHPAYLLRQPQQKRLAWRDFLTIKAALDGKL
ncbi:uracil-DNA glycosylase [Rhodobium gokarnense]|uniref:Type-4 uracil-DNA glycosylase n=1 Tax=Rhodobium gokarnense TaxID=364296 RepID=A0ABT3HIJ3_9HYPH|nr:uracil-DNA glycosylase [Rhodobium gokarnense]MCW2310236.1 DNA polymerase [Rhodobium gokarnense]